MLDDDGVKQTVIKTIHGRGYQFIAPFEGTVNIPTSKISTAKSKKFRMQHLLHKQKEEMSWWQ